MQPTLLIDLPKEQVVDLQTKLQALGYYTDLVDGLVGRNTATAWAKFKKDNWLGETDMVGESSLALLNKASVKSPIINWNDFNSKISKYFTVGEVSLRQAERLVTNKQHQSNAIRLALELDKVREWWGSPLIVTSWYRPPAVERRIGGSGYSHPFGLAADIKPASGSVWDLQRKFEKEWYNTGKWKGGFGRGSKRGFIHLDLRERRVWNY
jgi:uncharacterized protein YcbK (DUF882 family)